MNTRYLAHYLENPAPTITDVTPGSGAVGDSITITGTGFENISTEFNKVSFNGTVVAVEDCVSWSDTEIVVLVPVGATTGDIIVTNASNNSSSGWAFTVTGGAVPRCYVLIAG
ncbi:MAG: IPT/TIG domain-containing protein [Pseudomonadota bacterium]